MPRYRYTHESLYHLLTHLRTSNVYAIAIGFSSILGLTWAKKWRAKNRHCTEVTRTSTIIMCLTTTSSLVAIVMGTLFAYTIIKIGDDVPIVGNVPAGDLF